MHRLLQTHLYIQRRAEVVGCIHGALTQPSRELEKRGRAKSLEAEPGGYQTIEDVRFEKQVPRQSPHPFRSFFQGYITVCDC